ncbi:iron complex transport system permease protein [Spinactinospora alkalitolerans]|uniref:Iron complex transport system permease protein n=1 Tax=Spinactinospora alkalitolerans TaxID=687207 RepID=A0A852U484_9ACTN|nr:iron ABC transporter permease [Spinactinospora alkalitolerans]NYE50315.1 iron complex transport system permease protein [Spinactinospora alkalitolerans]
MRARTAAAPARPRGGGRAAFTRNGRLRAAVVLPLLGAALLVMMTFGVMAGSVDITFADTWRILIHRTLPGLAEPTWPRVHETIVLTSRLPRVLLAAVVGAGLALIGMVLQALVRNPLADPLLLGVSSGATFGAVAVVILGINLFGLYSLSVSAFLGALVALLLVYAMARVGGRMTTTRLVLAGVAVGQVLSAVASLLIITSGEPHAMAQVARWTMGGLGGTGWDELLLPSAVVTVALALLLTQARAFNLLFAGEEAAVTMGLSVDRFRAVMVVATSLVTGVMVAVSGMIGFVGLMVPHVARLLVGADHRRALPVATLLGAAFLVLADLAARTLASPEEIPVGILTALCGGPFFLWLMRRDARRTKGRV